MSGLDLDSGGRDLDRGWRSLETVLLQPDPHRLVAVGETSPPLDHATLCRQAGAFASWLQSHNCRRLALFMADAGELAIALLGAWQAGAAVTLPGDDRSETRTLLADRTDLWLDRLPAELASPVAPLSPAAPQPCAQPLDREQCGVTLCTSGSSGDPKFIDKRLWQLAREVDALERCWGAALGDATHIGTVSAQHIYGLLFRVLWPLCAGRPFVRTAPAFPEALQRVTLAQPAAAWVASPALLKRMSDTLDWSALRGLRALFSSGGALPTAAAATLRERLGQWPVEVYGSSETGGIGWRQGSERWQPLPGVALARAENGTLAVRSPWLPGDLQEQTADAVELAADGSFLLAGRLDRIVKLEEKRISLPLLERALGTHAWVEEARLGLISDRRAYLGAIVALSEAGLFALRNQGRRAVTEGLRNHLADHCERLALPRRWRLLAQLPVNAQGKLPQATVDTLLAAARPLGPELLTTAGDGLEWLLTLQVPPDLAHFSGHFPTTPVLPGVVQLEWVQRLAPTLMPLPPRFAGIEVLKFQRLVRPGDTLQLTLRFDAARGKLHFAFRCGDAPCSSGRILLTATGGEQADA